MPTLGEQLDQLPAHKLAEWRARGWNVGIATGDLTENLHAPVPVVPPAASLLRAAPPAAHG